MQEAASFCQSCGHPVDPDAPQKPRTGLPLLGWAVGAGILVVTAFAVVALRSQTDAATATSSSTSAVAAASTTVAPATTTTTTTEISTTTAATTTTAPATTTVPSTTTTTTTTTTTEPPPAPPGDAQLLAAVDALGELFNDPPAVSVMILTEPATVVYVETLHWNGGLGAAPGLIGIVTADGTVHGPWPARGRTLDGVTDAYWVVGGLDVRLEAGPYGIFDSDPATWSHNEETLGQGVYTVYGYPAGADPAQAAIDLIDGLLTACGIVEIYEYIVLEESAQGTRLEVRTAVGPAFYLIGDPGDPATIVPQDPLAADLAIECGYATP